jgi:hypothetical protein
VASLDEVFRTEGVRVATTPYRAPRANAVRERWIGSARREALDWPLIAGERHLRRVLTEHVERPHRTLGLRAPLAARRRRARRGLAHRRLADRLLADRLRVIGVVGLPGEEEEELVRRRPGGVGEIVVVATRAR